MRAPAPYRAQDSYLDQEESKDQTLEPDRADANDNGSSTPPAPKPYQPPTESVSAARPVQTTQAPTFSQMQAAGEARPPMPESAPDPSAGPTGPMSTLSGDWQAPTASAQSAPLIASAAGGTMTPQGDAANSFRGYQTEQGGGFGGYGTAVMPDTGTTMKDFDTKVGEGIKNFNFDFSQINPAELQQISQMSANANGAEADQGDALRKKLYQGGQLTPTEQYFLAFQSGQAPQVYRPEYGASGASPTGWKQSANDMNALGGVKTMREWAAKQAPQAPAPVNAGNWTAADPAEQERLLAQMASGEIPSGPQAYTPPSATPQAAPSVAPAGPVAAPEAYKPAPVGSVITTQTGGQNTGPSAPATQGAPVSGGNTNSAADILGLLTKGATDPGRYGTQQVKDSYNWLGGNIDDEYALRERQLKEDMSRRGLSDSTINAGNLKDLNIGRRSAKEALAYDLGDKVASTGAQDKASTLDYLRGLMGYGQQGFENDMTTAKFNADQETNWQDFLMKMLGAGYAGG